MNNDVTEVSVRAVLPMEQSCAVFLGNEKKTFVIYVHEQAGQAISMALRHMPTDRPMTHELMGRVLRSFGAAVERVIINAVNGQVFYARLIISAKNELHARKVVELDARPSDSIVLAVQAAAPIYVANEVLNTVEDASSVLNKVQSGGLDPIQFSALAALGSGGVAGTIQEENVELDPEEEEQIEKLLADLPDLDEDDDDDLDEEDSFTDLDDDDEDDDDDDDDLFLDLEDEDEAFDEEEEGEDPEDVPPVR
jgi:uncharacterized protein